MTLDAVFEACRPRLTRLAYGMLGELGEAEDVVQDAWLRFAAAETGAIRDAEAWLVAVTTRLAIDQLRSARRRREHYVGPWLPEPLVADPAQPDPAAAVERGERLSMALLVALERLHPVERAVFLLRDVFDLDYAEIADAVGRTPAACRQVARRARRHVGEPARRQLVPAGEEARLVQAFVEAAGRGDLQGLVAILAHDANVYSDGGGVVPAARKPIYGADRAARFLVGVQRKADFLPEYVYVRVNGDPGFTVAGPQGVFAVVALEVADTRIANVRIVYNPNKLRRV